MAQPGSAHAWAARGREFESRRPDHSNNNYRLPTLAAVLALWQSGGLSEPLKYKPCILQEVRQRRIVGDVFTFIESSIFERVLPTYLDDDEYSELQQYLRYQNPEAGEVVPGTGGLRKVRWARPGAGKRGGLSDHLFCSVSTQRVLDVDPVCKGKAREHSCAHPKAAAGGV